MTEDDTFRHLQRMPFKAFLGTLGILWIDDTVIDILSDYGKWDDGINPHGWEYSEFLEEIKKAHSEGQFTRDDYVNEQRRRYV